MKKEQISAKLIKCNLCGWETDYREHNRIKRHENNQSAYF